MAEVTTWQGSCEECAHWQFHDDGTGHCGLYSCGCANAITDGREPTRFLGRVIEEDDEEN